MNIVSHMNKEHRKRRRRRKPQMSILNTKSRKQTTDTKSSVLINNNEQAINGLKRQMKHINLTRKNVNYLSISAMLSILIVSLILIVIETNCDVICQKDTSFMLPCSCQNGTSGLLIKCRQSNLALLSNTLQLIQDPIEQLEFDECSISRLFGPIFSNNNTYKWLHNGNLRELSIRNSNLKQIDHASLSDQLVASIQYLQLDHNLLEQVPRDLIGRLAPNLKLVNLSANLFTQIDTNSFGSSSIKLTNLTELDLSSNKINRLGKNAFNLMSSLEYLNLHNNELTKLEKNIFNFGRKLKYLDLSSNKLNSLDRQDFNELTALEFLSLANNQLATIPRSIFTRNAKLHSLDMSFNQLDDIDTYLFKSVRFLKDLNLSGNKIRELGKNVLTPTTRLKRIDLSSNLIQVLAPETFKNLEWLERVDLSRNAIVNISNNAFDHTFSNIEIDLSHNKLTRIFYWAFHEMANITRLDLSHNLLSDGVSPIAFFESDCIHLDLSYNLLEDISKFPISNLTSIRTLNISHNQITEFNKKSFTAGKVPLYELASIDASHNNISQITGNVLERLRSVRYLDLRFNTLRRLTSSAFGNSPTLLELDMSHNHLVEVVSGTLIGLVSLKSLDISHNRLKKMIPIPVALNSINLRNNEISQLSKVAFPSLNSLLELYLDYNRIGQLEEGTFSSLLALNTLSLNYNNLTTIPASTLKDLSSLQNLYLEGNSIQKLSRRSFGPTGMPIVFDLNLSHNNISQLADGSFEGLLQLLKLNLSYNQLQEISPETFRGLVSLQELDLSNNRLTRLENKTKSALDDLLSLERANLSFNKLSMITGKTFISSAYVPQRLVHLDLSNNLIGIIINNFADGMRRLEFLNLRNNIINEIYPNVLSNATRLRHLDLSHNKLRMLRDGAFLGNFVNLTTLSLASNKLVSINPATMAEFDRFQALNLLDLSGNRLDSFGNDYIRWIKRGTSVDLRSNQLECPCSLLPFVSWIESIKSLNMTLLTSGSSSSSASIAAMSRLTKSQSAALTPLQLQQKFQNSAKIIANTSCLKPDILTSKPLTHLLDLTSNAMSQTTKELNCAHSDLLEADAFKRLKAPIQFAQANSYQDSDGNQILRISWNLVAPKLNLLNFVLIRAQFKDAINLASIRIQKNDVSSQKFGIMDISLDEIGYNQRSFSYTNLDSSGHHIVCLTHETGDPNNELDLNIQTIRLFANNTAISNAKIIDDLTTSAYTNHTSTVTISTLDNMIGDFNRFNCIELANLLHHDVDISERLISSSNPNIVPHAYTLICLIVSLNCILLTYHFKSN